MQERQLQAGVWRSLTLRTLVFGFGMVENMSKKREKTARMGILCLRSLVSYEIISNFVVRKDV